MKEKDAQAILDALDMLGLALVHHEHQWTAEERAAYQNALIIINRHKTSQHTASQHTANKHTANKQDKP